jgi:hypothetical protein
VCGKGQVKERVFHGILSLEQPGVHHPLNRGSVWHLTSLRASSVVLLWVLLQVLPRDDRRSVTRFLCYNSLNELRLLPATEAYVGWGEVYSQI